MALGDHIVEIARLPCGELVQAEVVEEEQVRREPAPKFPGSPTSATTSSSSPSVAGRTTPSRSTFGFPVAWRGTGIDDEAAILRVLEEDARDRKTRAIVGA